MAKILVVDDREDNRQVLERMLEFARHVPVTARNGQEALSKAAAAPPDLVLMDLAMPEMDGWEATAQLRANPALGDIPVIVVTGHVTQEAIDRAFEYDAEDPWNYYYAAILALRLGDVKKSVLSFEEAMALGLPSERVSSFALELVDAGKYVEAAQIRIKY